MPRVTFLRDFDCFARPGVFVAYKAGGPRLIPTAHAERARAAGVLLDGKPEDRRLAGAIPQTDGEGAAAGARRGGS